MQRYNRLRAAGPYLERHIWEGSVKVGGGGGGMGGRKELWPNGLS